MSNGLYRIGITSASSLVGKELAEMLGESLLGPSRLVLLDDEETAGVVTAAGDEPAVIQRLDAESFDGMDFAFFAGSADEAKAQWLPARAAGASIIDLSGSLAGETGVPVRAPWVDETLAVPMVPDLGTTAVVAAHPAAMMLALVGARLATAPQARSLAVTLLVPASEHSQAAMDELHQQTVKLLSFQELPKEQFGAQVAFNLLPAVGEEGKIRLNETRQRIASEYRALGRERLPELELQVVQVPVFHGYTASVLVEFEEPATLQQVERALVGPHLDLVREGSDPPSNLSAAGQDEVLVQVRPAESEVMATRFWLWLAADNLRLSAMNGLACALQLRRLRPVGKVQ